MPLSQFAPLAEVEGVRLVSLQKGYDSERHQRSKLPFEVQILPGLDEADGAFLDTAAVIKNLDLVVTNDTAVAHLAGAHRYAGMVGDFGGRGLRVAARP